MQYDPVKDRLGGIADRHPVFKRAFFGMLNLVFLRAWYVKREIRQILGLMRGRKRVDVLDAGTGFAQYAYLMARDFPNVHVLAVDVKEDYLQSARRFIDTTPQRDRSSSRRGGLRRTTGASGGAGGLYHELFFRSGAAQPAR